MKRHLLLLLIFLLCACDDVKRFVKPTQPPARMIDVICDANGGSGLAGCTPSSLAALLREVVPELPAGSVVRLHGMTDDVAASSQLATFRITAPKKRTVRAVGSHRRRQTEALVSTFVSAAQPLFARRDRRQSPIFETIARVLLLDAPPTTTREVYISTDARHVSKGSLALKKIDYECGPILTPEELAPRLRSLLGTTAEGVILHFRHVTLEPVAHNRCSASVERYALVKESFTAFAQIGARVTWNMN